MHVSNPCVHIVRIHGEMLGVQRFEGEYLVEMTWYDTVHFKQRTVKTEEFFRPNYKVFDLQ